MKYAASCGRIILRKYLTQTATAAQPPQKGGVFMILILFSVAIVAGVLGLIKINDNEDDLFTTLKYLGTEFLLLVGTFLIYDLTCDTFQIIDVSEFGYSVQDTALIIPLIFFIASHLALRPKVRYFYISGSIAVVIMSILLSEPAGNLYAIALLILPLVPVALLLQRSGDFFQTFFLAVVKIWSCIAGLISLWVGWTDDSARGYNYLVGLALQCVIFILSIIMYFIHSILDKRRELTNGHQRLCFVLGFTMIFVMGTSIISGNVQKDRYETADGTLRFESYPDHEPGAADEAMYIDFTSADGKRHENLTVSTLMIHDLLHSYKAGETIKLAYIKQPKYNDYANGEVRIYMPFYTMAALSALAAALFFLFYTRFYCKVSKEC